MEAESYFHSQARSCRRLARQAGDHEDKAALLCLARHYDDQAAHSAANRSAAMWRRG